MGATTVITNSGRIWSESGYGIYAENVAGKTVPVGSFTLTNTGTIGGNIGVDTASNIFGTVSASSPSAVMSLFGVSFGVGGNWKMTDTVSLYGAINGTALDNNASIDAISV